MIHSETEQTHYYFSVTCSDGTVGRFELEPGKNLFIGSSSNCGIRLPGQGLSPIHCHITQEDGNVFVKDWMSKGGTNVNGQRIDDATRLVPGDVITANGNTIRFESRIDPVQRACMPSVNTIETISKVDGHDILNPEHAEDVHCFPQAVVADEDDFFEFDFSEDEQEVMPVDGETIALMQAEIDELRSAVAQRDAELALRTAQSISSDDWGNGINDDDNSKLLARLEELIDEANRSDERAAMLEELLHAAEDSNRSEQEERRQLENWVSEIESRIARREDEQSAEVEILRQRINDAAVQQQKMLKKFKDAIQANNASQQFDETIENLQAQNHSLQSELDQLRKERGSLIQKVEDLSVGQEKALREERASIAKEQAKLARMRYELSSKLAEIQASPQAGNTADQETATRIRALREHLREIHLQEKQEEKESSLSTRLSRLWRRLEH